MVNRNRQDNGEPEGEDQSKNVVILHGRRGYGVATASGPAGSWRRASVAGVVGGV